MLISLRQLFMSQLSNFPGASSNTGWKLGPCLTARSCQISRNGVVESQCNLTGASVALLSNHLCKVQSHNDVIKWKHFPRYWPFVRGIHRPPVNSSHKGQWCGALMLSLICAQINGRVNNGEAGDLRRHRAHYDVIVMRCDYYTPISSCDAVYNTF